MVYEIYVRSFADSDGDGIGDLRGITNHLDYLESLGVDVVWLMPIYPSPSDHGYDVTDYLGINPDYGSLSDLQTLVQAAHARNIRLLLDFVPSHVSNQHPFFKDAYKNPASKYSEWFVWSNEAHTTYAGFGGNEAMPRLNHYNPQVVTYLEEVARHWLDLDGDGDYTDGVDGFRVDNATFPPRSFLVSLRQAVKAANPQALLLGEAWVHSPSDLGRFFPDQFDALFDFPFYELLQGNHEINGDSLLAGKGSPVLLTRLFQDEKKAYPPQALAVRFLNNHDTNRLASELAGDQRRLRLAPALLAALPGPVMLYYGEEIGMPGQKGGPPYWDNYRREPMDWYGAGGGAGQTTWFRPEDRWNRPGDGISVEEEEANPDSLLQAYRRLFRLRHSHVALLQGDFTGLDLDVSGPGPWGFVRHSEGESIVCLYNFSDEARQVTVESFPFSSPALSDLMTETTYAAAQAGMPYEITLPPVSALWLTAQH
jgi:glycosidase